MKYSLKKRVIYTVLIAALLIGSTLITTVGADFNGWGSAKNIPLGLDLAGGVSITYEIKDANPSQADIDGTIKKLENRVASKSTESQVYPAGNNRITVEIPGVTDANAILEELGTPGTLEFLDSENYQLFAEKKEYTALLTGNDVSAADGYADTSSTTTSFGVQLTFNADGTEKFAKATEANYGKPIYIVYDGSVISYPVVQAVIKDGVASITGLADWETASELATYIRIGAIPLQLEEVSSNIVGAQLGHDAIKSSLFAAALGLVVLCIYMIVMYRIPGVVATFALWMYTAMVLVCVAAFDMTLTLPGIAGIILGIGMAVDANVVIYSRIKEELGLGKSVENSIGLGYHKATSAIVDGNITTLIAAVVLYIFGTGPIKGFATTLGVGILVSMFTALVVSRIIIKLFYSIGFTDAKWYGKTVHRKTLNVLSIRKWCFTCSAIVAVIGFIAMGIFSANGKGILNFSLEFIGGTTTTFTFEREYSQSEVENDIIPVIKKAANVKEVQQQKVKDSTKVSFKTSDLDLDQRIAVDKAVSEKFPLAKDSIVESDTIGASVSSSMKQSAIISVIISTICMLLYIWFRFRDVKFATAAVVALIHDVLIVLAFYALSRTSVGNTFIAVMLTLVGYSINATIIIFDRIREGLKVANEKTNIADLVNESVTCTFSRSINTNITTFIMLFALFVFGVDSVREFALPLMVGVIVGAYSSVCMTSPLWYVFGGRKRGVIAEAQKEKPKKNADGSIV